MKNSKLLLVLAASATLTLAACNNQNDIPASSESESLSQSVAEKYAVTVTAHELLNISVDKAQAEAGERVTITVTPKKASVMLDAVKVNGVELNAIGGVYAFEMPANAVTVSAEAHDRHSVTIGENLPEGVAAVANKQYADAGEVVEVTLEYDETALTIQFVMAGTMFCGQKSNKVYYFVMPDGDIEILVGASQGVNHGLVDISEHANVLLPDECVSGAAVSFSFTIDLGYDFDDIEILDADGNAIAWAFDEEEPNMVNFNMPASAVSVNVKTTVGFFEIASSKEDKNIYEIAYENEGEFVRSTDGHFPFGARIRVLMKDTDEEQFSRLSISGIGNFERADGAAEGDYLAYYFNMPARKVGLTVEKQDLLHEVVVNKDEAAHFNFSLYMKDEAGNYIPADGAKIYTEAYVKAELIEGFTAADYELSSLKIEYKTHTSSYTYNNSRDLLKSSSWTTGLNEDGYYGFTLAVSTGEHMALEGEDAKVTLIAVEKDLQIWKGKSWLGSYLGLEVGSSHGDKFANSYNITIDGAGEYKGRSGPFLISADDVDNKVVTMSTIGASTPDTKKFAYGENLILAHDYPQDTVLGNTADWLVAVKKASADDADADYTVKAEHFGVNSNSEIYGAVQFFHNGEAYANAFIDYTGGHYYIDGVTFNFLNGEYVTDDSASYEVIVGGEVIKSIGTKAGATGYNNRMYLDGYQGTYDVVDSDENHANLVLDGVGGATYGSLEYAYAIGENNHITINRVENTDLGAITYVGDIELNVEGKTGTLVSMTHNEPKPYEFILASNNIDISSRTHYEFVEQDLGNGQVKYVSNNKAQSNSVAEMSLVAYSKMGVSFDYVTSGDYSSSSLWDYFAIYKNNKQVDKFGDTNGTYSIALDTNDVLTFVYVKDGSDNGAASEIDGVELSNFVFSLPGKEEGEYTLSNGKTMNLDGFGTGYTYDAENGTIMFSENLRDANNPWLAKAVNYTGAIDIAAKTIAITDSSVGDLQGSKYKGYNMYSTGVDTKAASSLTATFNVSAENVVSGTKTGSISGYDSETGNMMVGSNFCYYNAELDIFWMAYSSNASSVGTDTYIFFNSNVAEVVAVKYGAVNSKYCALLKIEYADGSIRYAFCETSKIYEDVTFSTATFPTSNSASITISDKAGNQIFSK